MHLKTFLAEGQLKVNGHLVQNVSKLKESDHCKFNFVFISENECVCDALCAYL